MTEKINIEVSNGPDYTLPDEVLNLVAENEGNFFQGDMLEFPYLQPKFGLKLIEAKAMNLPSYDERDEETYGEFDTQILLTIHANCMQYPVKDEKSETLNENLKKWILDDCIEYAGILSTSINKTDATYHEVSVVFLCDYYIMSERLGKIISSPFLDTIWVKRMEKLISEGVCYVHGKVSKDLYASLSEHINHLAENTNVDYHPNSNNVVRDLVHPALYPYIKGISKLQNSEENISAPTASIDFWGRPYEDSKFQWLPTPFYITEEKNCIIKEYINNLDRQQFPELYTDLEKLFEVFLPYLEDVWSYAKAMQFFKQNGEESDNDDYNKDEKLPFEKKLVSFKGKELQVIVKIVEYTLQPGGFYEGVWHAEGMSHENIVMTGILFLDRDPELKGGDLRFKRAFTVFERNRIFWSISQDRPVVVNKFAEEGYIPLGHFPTEEGYLLVFPNCHIHKISKLINLSNVKSASRRIVVFFVVNPERKIISTREVPMQQNLITLSTAKNYRLELMAERKYDKEKLNVRDIELCEH